MFYAIKFVVGSLGALMLAAIVVACAAFWLDVGLCFFGGTCYVP